jgi:toxin ParE1/3/4
MEQAYRRIQRQSGTGSPRNSHELNLPGLRFWGCKRFPYLLFHVEKTERIEVWRLLHEKSGVPAWMQSADGTA